MQTVLLGPQEPPLQTQHHKSMPITPVDTQAHYRSPAQSSESSYGTHPLSMYSHECTDAPQPHMHAQKHEDLPAPYDYEHTSSYDASPRHGAADQYSRFDASASPPTQHNISPPRPRMHQTYSRYSTAPPTSMPSHPHAEQEQVQQPSMEAVGVDSPTILTSMRWNKMKSHCHLANWRRPDILRPLVIDRCQENLYLHEPAAPICTTLLQLTLQCITPHFKTMNLLRSMAKHA